MHYRDARIRAASPRLKILGRIRVHNLYAQFVCRQGNKAIMGSALPGECRRTCHAAHRDIRPGSRFGTQTCFGTILLDRRSLQAPTRTRHTVRGVALVTRRYPRWDYFDESDRPPTNRPEIRAAPSRLARHQPICCSPAVNGISSRIHRLRKLRDCARIRTASTTDTCPLFGRTHKGDPCTPVFRPQRMHSAKSR